MAGDHPQRPAARLRLAINLSHVQDWFGGDFQAALDVARIADEAGIDQLTMAEHVVMSADGAEDYPYGDFYQPLDDPWPEPIAYLGALAGVTRRIELSTGVLLAPLRPAVLLAKQLATLDCLSRGRVIAGLGVGWQRAEYAAAGVPWEHRFERFEETILAMRALWDGSPASFDGRHIVFERVFCEPRPEGRRRIPLWFGLAPKPRNLERIVRLADGWLPVATDPDRILDEVAWVNAACVAAGRDPASLTIRAMPAAGTDPQGLLRLGQDLARLAAGGVSVVQVYPYRLARNIAALPSLLQRLVEMRDAVNDGWGG